MKIVFLESDNLGSDMDFDQFSKLGEVTIYKETAPEEIAGAHCGCGCRNRE